MYRNNKAILIKEVESKSDLKKFVKFQYSLYKDNPYFVPPLIQDELATFNKKKNPSFKDGNAKLFLAYKDGEIVGRIAGILSNPLNRKNNSKNLRFGWIETIDDYEVAKALFEAVENWGRQLGMTVLTGPHGFNDFDPQGMLIEGFDKTATIASYYHHPYYYSILEKYGFEKEVDYIEFWSTVPKDKAVPEKMVNAANWVSEKYKFKLLKYDSVKDYVKRGRELFKLIEESFSENYGTVPLIEEQIEYYTKKYIGYINKELLKIVVDENDVMIGFIITMPSLSLAFQKAKGHLFPFGFYHILKALKTYNILDFYFGGVKKEYRDKGVDLIMAVDIVKSAIKLNFSNAESNQELEDNSKVQAQWKFFNPVMHKRRRIYRKEIT